MTVAKINAWRTKILQNRLNMMKDMSKQDIKYIKLHF